MITRFSLQSYADYISAGGNTQVLPTEEVEDISDVIEYTLVPPSGIIDVGSDQSNGSSDSKCDPETCDVPCIDLTASVTGNKLTSFMT